MDTYKKTWDYVLRHEGLTDRSNILTHLPSGKVCFVESYSMYSNEYVEGDLLPVRIVKEAEKVAFGYISETFYPIAEQGLSNAARIVAMKPWLMSEDALSALSASYRETLKKERAIYDKERAIAAAKREDERKQFDKLLTYSRDINGGFCMTTVWAKLQARPFTADEHEMIKSYLGLPPWGIVKEDEFQVWTNPSTH